MRCWPTFAHFAPTVIRKKRKRSPIAAHVPGGTGKRELATAERDKGLATHLETMIEDETSHYEETAKILRGWE